MANEAPHSPVYEQNTVVTDPESPDAVIIPDGANDGSKDKHPLEDALTPNEVAEQFPDGINDEAKNDPEPSETEVSRAKDAADAD